MSYDLSFDRRTATLLAICTTAIVFLLVAAGFLLGAQYRQPAHSTDLKPAKASPTPAAQKTQPPAPAAVASVAASGPTAPLPNAAPKAQVDIPANSSSVESTGDADTTVPVAAGYNLQFGAFREEANAEAALKQLKEKKVKAEVIPKDDAAGNTWYTVRSGNYPTLSAASAAAVPLRASTQQSVFVRPANRP